MAGTVVTTEETYGSFKKITFDWLSSSGGAADATTTKVYNGALDRVMFVPDGGGTAPDAAYDVTLLDDDSVDLLDGAGANLSATATYQLQGAGVIANGTLTLGVTNAGAANGGIIHIYIR